MSQPLANDPPTIRLNALTDSTREIPSAVIAQINALLFPHYAPLLAQADACLILGSRNCGYRVAAALGYRPQQPVHYIVSGGGLMGNGTTEAAFMAAKLQSDGISPEHILIDDSSRCTLDNLQHTRLLLPPLIANRPDFRLILVTAGFHLCRTLALAQSVFSSLSGLQIFPLPAYGPRTSPANWHRNTTGRQIIAEELTKLNDMGLLPTGRLIAD